MTVPEYVLRYEVVLPRRVLRQPVPSLVPGGDCGACVLAGLTGRASVQDVYDARSKGEPKPISYWDMRQALIEDVPERLDRTCTNVAFWVSDSFVEISPFGFPATCQAQAWFAYVRMAIDAGYYAVANVASTRNGKDTDHWVLICGVRELYPAGSGIVRQELLVSCSSVSTPDEEWVGLHEVLGQRGGFNALLARPSSQGG